MQFNHTISAILRGTWLLDKQWADVHVPLVVRMLKGETVNFGQPAVSEDKLAVPMQVSAAGYKVGYYTSLNSLPQGSVAIVDLSGPITRYGGECTYGLEHKANLMRSIYAAGNISGVILSTNTPGGEASGTAMFADVIRKRNKPVIAHVEDGMAASAGMWIVAQCDEIYASNKQSSVGSIGAYTMLADWNEYFRKEGLPIHEIYAPQSTDKNKDYRDALTGEYGGIESHLSELVEHFISSVKSGRAGKIAQKGDEPFTGKMYNAAQAKKLGLIDGVASLEDVIAKVKSLSTTKKYSSKNSVMATNKEYPHLSKTTGWTEGAQADDAGNISLSENDADAVETALSVSETQASDLQAEKQKNTALTGQVAALTQERDAWKAKAEEYGAQSANKGTNIKVDHEKTTDTGAQPKPMDEVTAQAMKLYMSNPHRKKD